MTTEAKIVKAKTLWTKGNATRFQLGQILSEIRDEGGPWSIAGKTFDSFHNLMREAIGISPGWAHKLVRVYEHFSQFDISDSAMLPTDAMYHLIPFTKKSNAHEVLEGCQGLSIREIKEKYQREGDPLEDVVRKRSVLTVSVTDAENIQINSAIGKIMSQYDIPSRGEALATIVAFYQQKAQSSKTSTKKRQTKRQTKRRPPQSSSRKKSGKKKGGTAV